MLEVKLRGAGPVQGLRPVLLSSVFVCYAPTKRDRRFGAFLGEEPAKKMCTVLADGGLA